MNCNRTLLTHFLALTAALVLSLPLFAQKAPEIPAGTIIKVRTIDKLTSEDARVGDTFRATLEEPLIVNDKELYPRGSEVNGRVVYVKASGRLSEPGELNLVLNTVSSGGRTSSLRVEPLVVKAQSHAKSNTTKIGGGAALGAIIGAVAGGGKGAAIGAGAGAAAGTGAAAATGKREIEVLPETVLSFTTSTAVEVLGGSAVKEMPVSSAASSTSTSMSSDAASDLFTLRDRRVIRACLEDHASELPAGITKKPELTPGQERSLARAETVPPAVARKLQSLPLACVDELPKLAADQERVVYGGRVLLIDGNYRILDLFDIEETR